MVNVYGARLKTVLSNEKKHEKKALRQQGLALTGTSGRFSARLRRPAYFDW
jgi:hypothetical protein